MKTYAELEVENLLLEQRLFELGIDLEQVRDSVWARVKEAENEFSNLLGSISEPVFLDDRLDYVLVQIGNADLKRAREYQKKI
ncbi:MAG: hypothetical protein AAGB31_12155 [Bdellovibrio sp.]